MINLTSSSRPHLPLSGSANKVFINTMLTCASLNIFQCIDNINLHKESIN